MQPYITGKKFAPVPHARQIFGRTGSRARHPTVPMPPGFEFVGMSGDEDKVPMPTGFEFVGMRGVEDKLPMPRLCHQVIMALAYSEINLKEAGLNFNIKFNFSLNISFD
ncbi:hypothetical protein AVEN_213935-1 [Araneus ventricosus]|uniref:Uncharacterized protein n=1 Tax=Araneus ventricosus TaxID=182803 RepID=A0A4Y2PVN2_ARAVE|nr:hypothetical protein AVEN_213935-1 [Araneus ventricosus]